MQRSGRLGQEEAGSIIPLEIGDSVSFAKTVGESDVYLFAGITGDFSPNHVNKEIMGKTPYKERISVGYDHIRFIKPIFIGDTVTVTYTISEIDEENLRTRADIEVANQRGEVCTVAQHILKYLE